MNTTTVQEKLGLDFGNTIVEDGKPLPDALRVIKRLSKERFHENIHIISKVNPEQEIRVRNILMSDLFQAEIGIPMSRIHFCAERRDKAAICAKIGNITYMIDDRPEAIVDAPVRYKILFRPRLDELYKYTESHTDILRRCIILKSWIEIENFFFRI